MSIKSVHAKDLMPSHKKDQDGLDLEFSSHIPWLLHAKDFPTRPIQILQELRSLLISLRIWTISCFKAAQDWFFYQQMPSSIFFSSQTWFMCQRWQRWIIWPARIRLWIYTRQGSHKCPRMDPCDIGTTSDFIKELFKI